MRPPRLCPKWHSIPCLVHYLGNGVLFMTQPSTAVTTPLRASQRKDDPPTLSPIVFFENQDGRTRVAPLENRAERPHTTTQTLLRVSLRVIFCKKWVDTCECWLFVTLLLAYHFHVIILLPLDCHVWLARFRKMLLFLY